MKTKILCFFLLLVMGVGNGFAENTSRDSLFQEITKNPRSFAKNWNTIPGSDNDKFLAILTGKTIQIKDQVLSRKIRSRMDFSKLVCPVSIIIFATHGYRLFV